MTLAIRFITVGVQEYTAVLSPLKKAEWSACVLRSDGRYLGARFIHLTLASTSAPSLVVPQQETKRSVCVNAGFRWQRESWSCDFRAGCKQKFRNCCPQGSGDLSKWGNPRLFPLEFELLLRTCALLSCGPFTAAAMKTFILQQVKWCPLNSFNASAIFSFTGPKAAGWCLIIYSLHPLSSTASGITFNVRRVLLLIS